jgi:hypothetical protein
MRQCFSHFNFRSWAAFMGSIAIVLGSQLQAWSQSLSELLSSTPDRANAILYVDAPSVRSFVVGTPLHKDLPESVGEVRIAADLDLKTFRPNWEIGYVSLTKMTDASGIATKLGGYVDSIMNRWVVWSPNGSYVVPMANNQVGLVRPSDRKLISRWLKKDKSAASDFLAKQAAQSSQFFSVLLAIDAEDVWSPIAIEERISKLNSIKSLNAKQVVSLLSTLKGIRVVVSKKNLDDCIISVEFGSSPELLLPVARDFFVEVLERNQSSIPEAAKWTPSIEGNVLSFRGTISPATLDDLLGIFTVQQQPSALASDTSSVSPNSSAERVALDASKEYFTKVTGIVDRVRNYSASNTGDRAQWNARLANRIDELPTLNVDSDLVDFGIRVSKGLRGNVVAMQQANINYGTTSMVNRGTYGNSYDYSGGYYYDVNAPAKYQAVSQGVGNMSYRELISAIDQMIGDIRREMTQKFQVQF